ncbi:MAG: dihydroorotate dehydrogenase [Candidatus Altiarchaeota archaeon]
MTSLAVELAGLRLSNPTILASGVMGSTKASLNRVAGAGAGAVTTKSVTREPRPGHDNPQMVEVTSGYLNAVGYTNMGLDSAKEEFTGLGDVGVPVIGSIVAEDAEGFSLLAREFNSMEFDAIEVVLSCPHTPGLGLMGGQGTPEAACEVVSAVRSQVKKPLIVKLSPSVGNIGCVAEAAVSSGADVLNMGNTLGPGMVISLEARKPVLGFKVGGMSGPAVKPITIRCVYDVYEAVGGKTPIIATGGITYGVDAIEALMAGASAVGVGTAVKYRGLNAFTMISEEISGWMESNNVGRIKDLVGVAHG